MTDLAAQHDEVAARRIELDVTGMTCMMCARRVEKFLNRLDGVQASVKIATKIATVDAAPGVTVEQLCDAVQRAGYAAVEREPGLLLSQPDPNRKRGWWVALFDRFTGGRDR